MHNQIADATDDFICIWKSVYKQILSRIYCNIKNK